LNLYGLREVNLGSGISRDNRSPLETFLEGLIKIWLFNFKFFFNIKFFILVLLKDFSLLLIKTSIR